MPDDNTPQCRVAREPSRGDLDHFARLIAERGGDSIVFTDKDGYTEWVNTAFTRLSGYTVEELRGEKPGTLLQGPDTDPETVAEISRAVRNRETVRTEILNYAKTGDAYWIDIMIQPIFDDEDRLVYFMSIERDISERRRLIERMRRALDLEAARRRERKLLSRASEWFYMADDVRELQMVVSRAMTMFFPGSHGALFVYSNSRDMLERACVWGEGETPAYLHPSDCWSLRRGRAYRFDISELSFPCAHVGAAEHAYFCLPIIALGETIGLLHLCPADIESCGHPSETPEEALSESWELAVIIAEQISLALAKLQVQTQLRDRSVKDALTGLWNRRWFDDTTQREIDTCRSQGVPLSLIFLDIDHFKKFNDNNGHAAGDEVLRELGEILATHSSRSIHPCRIGGEEFAILCPSHASGEARTLADKIRAEISEITVVSGGVSLPSVTASTGIAELGNTDNAADIMARADKALYTAKTTGRNRTELSAGDMSQD